MDGEEKGVQRTLIKINPLFEQTNSSLGYNDGLHIAKYPVTHEH